MLWYIISSFYVNIWPEIQIVELHLLCFVHLKVLISSDTRKYDFRVSVGSFKRAYYRFLLNLRSAKLKLALLK